MATRQSAYRINLYFDDDELNSFIQDERARLGLSQNAFVLHCIREYIKYKQSLDLGSLVLSDMKSKGYTDLREYLLSISPDIQSNIK